MTVGASSDSDAVIANPLRASGLVDAVSLERARAHALEHRTSLADALLRLGLIKEVDFLRVFAELYSTRFVKAEKLRALKLDEHLLEQVGVRVAERLHMCPIRWDYANHELHVVACVPLSANLEPALRQQLGAKIVTVYVATEAAVAALVRRAFYRQDDAFEQVTSNGAGPARWVMADDEPDVESHEATAIARIALPPEKSEARAAPTSLDVPAAVSPFDTLPPQVEGKTVMVNLEALTITTLRRENARYRIAQEFHRRVSLERSVEAMIDRILSVIFELLAADGAAVWLTTGQFAAKTRERDKKVEVPRAVIEQVMASPNGLLANNALVDERFGRSESVMVRGVKSVMAVPLHTRTGTVGILYVESTSMSAAFTEDDLPLLDSIGAQAALLLDNAALVTQVQKEVETRVSLSRFLSRAAVDEVMSGRLKVNFEGQASDITVLFADIRGFTTLSSQLRPHEVVRFLNEFFGGAAEAVEKHGGIIDKFIGDCVMAVWGAVSPREDDARSAIKASLEMIERASRILVQGSTLQVGVGINTGSAVVGAIGGKKRSDYTVVGATVNLAARLCGIAEAGEVLITAETLMRAGPGVMNDAQEAVVVKGLDVPIVPYRVRGLVQPLQLSQAVTVPRR